ncbi:DUF1580 domain-containing protein [Schlesneria paludicola]|uniref:DUF1580 domain-containing protein n=1 Tax=Schlesneria paludicola TaxID=360056 RepID=UPI000311B028|nr:DUF1580 domain-containing protein [Schlesneria paludicola]
MLNENLVSISCAADEFPGGKISRQTLYRHATRGSRGIVLESVLVGGKRRTSTEAIARFLTRLNSEDRISQRSKPVETPDEILTRSRAARSKLKAMGI